MSNLKGLNGPTTQTVAAALSGVGGGGGCGTSIYPKPTASDPLGQLVHPGDFARMLEQMVDARIDQRWRGRTSIDFDGVSSRDLLLELVARGFAVYKPSGSDPA